MRTATKPLLALTLLSLSIAMAIAETSDIAPPALTGEASTHSKDSDALYNTPYYMPMLVPDTVSPPSSEQTEKNTEEKEEPSYTPYYMPMLVPDSEPSSTSQLIGDGSNSTKETNLLSTLKQTIGDNIAALPFKVIF